MHDSYRTESVSSLSRRYFPSGVAIKYKHEKQYPPEFKKADKYSLRRTSKRFSVEIAKPTNSDNQSEDINVNRPVLWLTDKGKKLLVIKGEKEKKRVFMECHSSDYGGHVGRDNTIKKIRTRYFWPEYYKDTISMIEQCDRCQRNCKEKKTSEVLHPIPVTPKPWYMIGIDLIDAHTVTQRGNRYILTQTDYFTKYVEACPIPMKSAECVARGLYQTFCRHGAPAHIITDQGREFVNQLQDEIFPKVSTNITDAQEKQKQQYKKRKGMISCPLKNKDLVLRRNMLQKTKMGHKMEDNWLGPYEVVDLDEDKGTCKLQSKKTGQVLKRRVPLKQLKPYIQSELDPELKPKDKTSSNDTVSNTEPKDAMTTKAEEHGVSNSCDKGDNSTEVQDGKSLISRSSVTDDDDDQDMDFASDLERVASLNEEDLERQMLNIEEELKDIETGKVNNWRKELLEKGRCHEFPCLRKMDFGFNVHLGPFTDEQLDVILRSLKKAFPQAGIDTTTKVLVPEACILIVRDVLGLSYQEAERYIDNPQSKNASLKRRCKATDNTEVGPKKQKVQDNPTTCTSEAHDHDCDITFEGKGTLTPNEMKRFERPQYVIEKDDKETILKSEMLTDRHIMMAQSLLKTQFPDIEGFLSPTLGPAGQFPPMANEFVQIINTMKTHWVCVSTIGCDNPGTINYCCSLNNTSLTKDTKKHIASLLHPDKSIRKIKIDVKPVHPQTGVDCGIHAIAITLALCQGFDPSTLKFNRREIRNHLWRCIETKQMSQMFPHQIRPCNGNETTILLPIYCRCRMPHFPGDEKMAACEKCKEWFHQSCEKIPNQVFKNKVLKWKCSIC